MEVKVIRSNRKTLSMAMKPEGLIVRAPLRTTDRRIQQYIESNQAWIKKAAARLERQQCEANEAGPLTDEDIRRLSAEARAYIPERVNYYAPQIGVTFGHITIRCQKSRWGSCSARGNLNFNCLLMLTPHSVIDSVVVHELCHRIEMNHSDRFYQEVLRVYPDYWEQHKWLKEHGGAIMQRARGHENG